MITAKRFKPEAIVKVYTEKGELVSRTKPKQEGDAIDSKVLSISTNNDLSVDAGVFTVTLTVKERWDKKIASNDLVIIYMKRDPNDDEKKSAVFFGLVDFVRSKESIQNGQVLRQITITGRSFAKVLINYEIGVVDNTGEVFAQSVGWLQIHGISFVGQKAEDNIKQLFDRLVKKYTNYTFSNGKTLMDMLKLKLDSRKTVMMNNDQNLLSYQGSMYNLFKELSDEPFNQMYFEVIDGEPTFILRETPFNPDKWKQLQPHTVTDEEIVDIDIGRNDVETYTLYSVGVANMFDIMGSQGTLGLKPLVYEPYLKKYGIRRLHRYTNYVAKSFFGTGDKDKNQSESNQNQQQSQSNQIQLSAANSYQQLGQQSGQQQWQQFTFDSSNNPTDVLKQYQIDLFNWNVMNPSFYSGQIIVRGDNRFKVGDRLIVETTEIDENGKPQKQEYEFFIEGVQQEFVNFSHWYTILSVTRGLPDRGKDRFEKPWGAYKEYEGGGAGDPTLAQLQQLMGGVPWAQSSIYGSLGDASKVADYYINSGTFKNLNNFGEKRPGHIHKGVDLSAPTGTPIYALFDGRVIKNAYQPGGAGYYVVIQHANGYVTKYFHMRERSPVAVGTYVKAGDLIGYVDSTGDSTGPHLHLEIWKNGTPVNPVPILKQLASGSSSSSLDTWLQQHKGGSKV